MARGRDADLCAAAYRGELATVRAAFAKSPTAGSAGRTSQLWGPRSRLPPHGSLLSCRRRDGLHNGMHPLIWACWGGHAPVVKFILSVTSAASGAAPPEVRAQALILACERGDEANTKQLLGLKGAQEVDAAWPGFTGHAEALARAVRGNHSAVIRQLLSLKGRRRLTLCRCLETHDGGAFSFAICRGKEDAARTMMELRPEECTPEIAQSVWRSRLSVNPYTAMHLLADMPCMAEHRQEILYRTARTYLRAGDVARFKALFRKYAATVCLAWPSEKDRSDCQTKNRLLHACAFARNGPQFAKFLLQQKGSNWPRPSDEGHAVVIHALEMRQFDVAEVYFQCKEYEPSSQVAAIVPYKLKAAYAEKFAPRPDWARRRAMVLLRIQRRGSGAASGKAGWWFGKKTKTRAASQGRVRRAKKGRGTPRRAVSHSRARVATGKKRVVRRRRK